MAATLVGKLELVWHEPSPATAGAGTVGPKREKNVWHPRMFGTLQKREALEANWTLIQAAARCKSLGGNLI